LKEIAGEAAMLVNPTDTDDIAAAIQVVASNADLRLTLTERGYEQAGKFTWQACARSVLEVLDDVAAR
jgi:glycosyltransferase involved in cell wall biosynthesis